MEKSDRKQARAAARRSTPSPTVRRSAVTDTRRIMHGLHVTDGPDYRDPESTRFTPDHPRIAL